MYRVCPSMPRIIFVNSTGFQVEDILIYRLKVTFHEAKSKRKKIAEVAFWLTSKIIVS